MKKSTKTAVLTAAALIVLGIVISGIGFRGIGFDFRALNTEDIVCNTFEISEEFRSISIETDTAELYFAVSEDDVCRVQCVDFANERYTVTVENGVLAVALDSHRAWHETISLFSVGENSVTVYLPQREYTSLQICENTGDIDVPAELSFEQAAIRTSTGDVYWAAPVSEELSIITDTGDVEACGIRPRSLVLKTDTGDISLSQVRDTQQLCIETDTGKIDLTNADCARFSADSNTGNITLKNVIAEEGLTIKIGSGDLVFDRSDAAEIFVQTDTGNVTGTLISDKVFLIETDTGYVDVPKSVTGGRCEINTDTGDIKLRIDK